MRMAYIVHEIPAEDADRMVLLPADCRDGYSARVIAAGDAFSCVAGLMKAERERPASEDRASQVAAARALLDAPDFDAAGRLLDSKITLGPRGVPMPAGGVFVPDPPVEFGQDDDGETD